MRTDLRARAYADEAQLRVPAPAAYAPACVHLLSPAGKISVEPVGQGSQAEDGGAEHFLLDPEDHRSLELRQQYDDEQRNQEDPAERQGIRKVHPVLLSHLEPWRGRRVELDPWSGVRRAMYHDKLL